MISQGALIWRPVSLCLDGEISVFAPAHLWPRVATLSTHLCLSYFERAQHLLRLPLACTHRVTFARRPAASSSGFAKIVLRPGFVGDQTSLCQYFANASRSSLTVQHFALRSGTCHDRACILMSSSSSRCSDSKRSCPCLIEHNAWFYLSSVRSVARHVLFETILRGIFSQISIAIATALSLRLSCSPAHCVCLFAFPPTLLRCNRPPLRSYITPRTPHRLRSRLRHCYGFLTPLAQPFHRASIPHYVSLIPHPVATRTTRFLVSFTFFIP